MKSIIRIMGILISILTLLLSYKIVNAFDSTKVYIDKPVMNEKTKSELSYSGWIMSEDNEAQAEIYIDGNYIEKVDKREKREDVLKAISEYGGRNTNSKPGYSGTIDLSEITDGEHIFTVKAKSSQGKILSEVSTKIEIKKYDTMIYVDSPQMNQVVDGELKYQGWIMSEYKDSIVNIYINDELIEEADNRYEREDVLKAISGYGGRNTNSKPGYSGTIDISNLEEGKRHKLTIEICSLKEKLESVETTFIKREYTGKVYIDKPVMNEKTKSELSYSGWIMSEDNEAQAEIYIDGNYIEKVDKREKREDVLKAISEYGGRNTNSKPGYSGTIDLSEITDGEHIFTVKAKSSQGKILSEVSTKIEIKKYDTKAYIDSPTETYNKKNIDYSGWVMSEDKDAKVEIYIDNNYIEDAQNRYARSDVLKAISGYGGEKTNKTPGYKGNLDYSKFNEGNHSFKIIVRASKTNEVLVTETTSFILKKYDTKMYIDSPRVDQVQKTTVDIRGWVMSEDSNGSIEIYLNNQKLDISVVREEREDVLTAISGYGGRNTNINPGFKATLDSSNLKNGIYTLSIRYISSEDSSIYTSLNMKITIKKYDGMMYIDDPAGANFSSDFKVRGWALTEYKDAVVKYLVDGNVFDINIDRNERPDVISAYPTAYGGATLTSKPEFNAIIPISRLSEGPHSIKIIAYSKLGDIEEEIVSETLKISISKGRYYGVDVSQFNGVIDWNRMRSMGIDYAFIRAAYRGYGSEGTIKNDSRFKNNIVDATNAGVRCGVYFFSQAMNYNEGVEEAQYLKQNAFQTYGDYIKLPVVIDSEYSTEPSHNGRADHLTRTERTNALRGFIDAIKSYGYTPMIYASTSWLNDNLDMSQLGDAYVWVAQWGPSVTYNGPYQVWQYTSSGPGLSYGTSKAELDMDYFYNRF